MTQRSGFNRARKSGTGMSVSELGASDEDTLDAKEFMSNIDQQ